MRVIAIPEDGFVSVDGEGHSGIDLSFMSSDIHALHWFGEDGEIEIEDSRGRIVENRVIMSLSGYEGVLTGWAAAKKLAEDIALKEQEDEARALEAQAAAASPSSADPAP